MSERESYAVYFLQQQGLSRERVLAAREAASDVAPGAVDERDFFISYAHADEERAREINQVLTSAGFTTVAQFKDFLPGANFVHEMQRALARSGRLIALYSPNYDASDHCQAEWSACYNQDPVGARGKLVPFMIAPTELKMLARQIVYTSLVGLDAPSRHMAILNAVRHIARRRSAAEVARDAAGVASPDVVAEGRRVDAVPNPRFDKPVALGGLADLPQHLREIAGATADTLPANAPPVIALCLRRYSQHLAERGVQPIVGLLTGFAAAIASEVRALEDDQLSPGVVSLLAGFLDKHALFTTYFPQVEARERFFAETPLDEDRAVGEALEQPVRDASAALEAVAEEGLTSRAFDSIVAGQRRQASDLASLPPAPPQPATVITPKRRFVLGSIGFYERVIAALGNVAKIGDSLAVASALEVLRRSVSQLLRLLM